MANRSTYRKLAVVDLVTIDFKHAWDLQKDTLQKRLKGEVSDTLYLLEHPHTYTLGKTADKKNLVGNEKYLSKNKISVYEIDRGGDITYHGPGQLVGYPIINLTDWKQDTHLYLRNLEEAIILTCADYGLQTDRIDGLTGVWMEDRKIAAIGIKVSRWITMHGFAFNVNTDLKLFSGIIPCGITDKAVTSLEYELGHKIEMREVKEKLVKNFRKVFEYEKSDVANERNSFHTIKN
jgi:lipoyl(octanoyl) transferase